MQQCKYLFLLVVLFLTACNRNQGESKIEDFLSVDNFKVNKGHKLDTANWRCNSMGRENICIPSQWEQITTDKAHFFSYLGNHNLATYFAVIRYEKEGSHIDSKRYLQEVYSQLKQDTAELAQGYTVKRLVFEKKEAYYCEYYTEINYAEYLTYSLLFEEEGFLYDFSLKIEKKDSSQYYKIFQDILFNFRINGKLFFNEKDKLKKIQIVDISTL